MSPCDHVIAVRDGYYLPASRNPRKVCPLVYFVLLAFLFARRAKLLRASKRLPEKESLTRAYTTVGYAYVTLRKG